MLCVCNTFSCGVRGVVCVCVCVCMCVCVCVFVNVSLRQRQRRGGSVTNMLCVCVLCLIYATLLQEQRRGGVVSHGHRALVVKIHKPRRCVSVCLCASVCVFCVCYV